jgi:hypothetical protein
MNQKSIKKPKVLIATKRFYEGLEALGCRASAGSQLQFFCVNISMVLSLEELIKIDIHQLVKNDYWCGTVGNHRLELNPVRDEKNYFLALDVNGMRTPKRWLLSTRPIRGRLQRGGSIPWDRNEVFYVVGADGRRCSYLYINAATREIGTRHDHRARYRCNCLSAKKRQAEKQFREAVKQIRKGQIA